MSDMSLTMLPRNTLAKNLAEYCKRNDIESFSVWKNGLEYEVEVEDGIFHVFNLETEADDFLEKFLLHLEIDDEATSHTMLICDGDEELKDHLSKVLVNNFYDYAVINYNAIDLTAYPNLIISPIIKELYLSYESVEDPEVPDTPVFGCQVPDSIEYFPADYFPNDIIERPNIFGGSPQIGEDGTEWAI